MFVRVLGAVVLAAGLLVLIGGCQANTGSRAVGVGVQDFDGTADPHWSRRAAMLRGATDTQWNAVKRLLDSEQPVDARVVFMLSELRTGAISAEMKLLMAERYSSFANDATEAKAFIAGAEPVLEKLVASGLVAAK